MRASLGILNKNDIEKLLIRTEDEIRFFQSHGADVISLEPLLKLKEEYKQALLKKESL